jgi:hypothetical protein
MPEGRDLEQFAVDRTKARYKENQELARTVRALKAELADLRAEAESLRSELAAVSLIASEAELLAPLPGWLKPGPSEGGKRATLVAVLSDVHAGERVDPDQVGAFNAYNLAICERRLKRFFEKIVRLAREYVSGVSFDGIVLALAGDMVSGTIHDELVETNELSTLDTILWLAPRLVSGIEVLVEEFGNVHVVSAPGNHGRDSKRPRYKDRSSHNADTMVARMCAQYFKASNRSSGATFHVPSSLDVDFEVYDTAWSVEHGEEFHRTNPGTSEIGPLGPVRRGSLRKARQRQVEGKRMDFLVVGHFHQYVSAPEQGFVMNGSLKGYDEYARGLHLKPERPQQALLVVTPEHGPTQSLPIIVGDRDAEGW